MTEKTKLYLSIDGKRLLLPLPEQGADHCMAPIFCPACKKPGPLKVQGTRKRIAEDDRAYESDGVAVCCGVYVGVLRLEVPTLFGLREDNAVLNGRCRVY